MRLALAMIVALMSCGGPSQQQLAETPSAQTRGRPAQAPPASSSDTDRERLNQSFEDMEITQRAHREAEQERAKSPPANNTGTPMKGPAEQAPKKKGPAEQAPKEPKRKGPAEQAP